MLHPRLPRPALHTSTATLKIMTAALLCTVLSSACTAAPEERRPPEPTVTAQEWEQRLIAHLSRFVTEILEADAHASKPAVSRTTGCGDAPGDGPAWGVVPRAEVTVSAGKRARKYLDDVQQWMYNNGFDNVEHDRKGSAEQLTGVHEDGTRVHAKLPVKVVKKNLVVSPVFTITVTGPCAWPGGRPGGPPPTDRLRVLAPPSGPTEGKWNVEEACKSPRIAIYAEDAKPYAGHGPHLMTLVSYTEEDPLVFSVSSLPGNWEPDDIDWDPRNRDEVQLLVCVRAQTKRDSGRNATCHYSYSSMPTGPGAPYTYDVFESVYHIVVREARNGRKVKEFTVPGVQGDEESCPYELDNRTRRLARGIDVEALHRKLRPLLE